jgi:hypothetical protein
MLLGMRSTLLSSFSPASLFAAGEQGVWYDPSDLTTLFQDSAGTTPVTAVEQPVGRMLDLSGRGNHATQSTSAARPVLSARVNLLERTEDFSNTYWTTSFSLINPFGSGSVVNATTAPDGTNTADLVTETTGTGNHYLFTAVFSDATTKTFSLCVKAAGRSKVRLTVGAAAVTQGVYAQADLLAGTITSATLISGAYTPVSSSIVNLGDGWYRCSVTVTTPATSHVGYIQLVDDSGQINYTGNGTSGLYIWGADLRATNDGVGLPVYQRVNTTTDYDTTGFPLYLRFDGTDDSMATGNISFTSTDKMTVFGGVRKINDTVSIYTELSANLNSSAGSFLLLSGTNNVTGFEGTSRGSAPAALGTTARFAIAAPVTAIVTDIFDISAPLARIRVNGVVGTDGTSSQGTGNYGNYPLYIGSRAGPSLPFNGRIYSLIVRGAASTAQQISDTETWVNGKTKAYA